jgi:hypothetical protein
LTGKVTLNIVREGGGKYSVDELEIYNRYKDFFPDLKIEYGENY